MSRRGRHGHHQNSGEPGRPRPGARATDRPAGSAEARVTARPEAGQQAAEPGPAVGPAPVTETAAVVVEPARPDDVRHATRSDPAGDSVPSPVLAAGEAPATARPGGEPDAKSPSAATATATATQRGEALASAGATSGPVHARIATQPAPARRDLAPVPAPVSAPAGAAPVRYEPVGAPGPRNDPDGDAMRPSCTVAQLRRFIKSRPWIPMHELRRRFAIWGGDDDVSPIRVGEHTLFIGLPPAESRLVAELLGSGDVGYELSLDPVTPVVVGVYPMRPVPRG